MTRAQHLHDDQWGGIIDRPDAGYIEIRWYDTTRDMTRDQFQSWLTTFVEQVEATSRTRVLVDAVQFRMAMENMDGSWRDEHIIPRYNAAGMSRFAFHMPAGMPAIGKPPAHEGPGQFPTAYFGTRADALAWLES